MPHIAKAVAAIESASFWKGGKITSQTIDGGLTNLNFKIEHDSRTYFGRLTSDRSAVGVDRRNEIACQTIAATLGFAPRIIHAANGVMITEFIHGSVLTEDRLHEQELLTKIARRIRELHKSFPKVTGELLYFCPFVTMRTYIERAKALGAEMPRDMAQIQKQLDTWEERCTKQPPAFCHGDYKFNNLIVGDDGNIWLVDWEYAGIGVYPLFDLAWLSGSIFMDAAQDDVLMRGYFGQLPSAQEVYEFKAYKALSLLRDAFWALIQDKTAEPITDFKAYAAEYLGYYNKYKDL